MGNYFFSYEGNQVKNKKIIVYGYGRDTALFMLRLIEREIELEVAYFLCPEDADIESALFFFRPVLSLKKLAEMAEHHEIDLSEYVLVASAVKYKEALYKKKRWNIDIKLAEFERFSDVVQKADHIVIYATGARAKKVYEDFDELLKVDFFADSSQEKWAGEFCGKEILSPRQVVDLENSVVIVASASYETIKAYLIELGYLENRIFTLRHNLTANGRSLVEWEVDKFVLTTLTAIHASAKDVILYGYEKELEEAGRKLSRVGLPIKNCVARQSEDEDGTVFELLYLESEHTVFMVLDKPSENLADMYRKTGIDLSKIFFLYQLTECARADYPYIGAITYDPTLGFARKSVSGPGDFTAYSFKGDHRPVRIVTLGGSTTDSYIRYSCWSYYLSQILQDKNIPHILYNGGVAGYHSGQELLKCVRDGLSLEPNIIINWSGTNDLRTWSNKGYSYLCDYQFDFMESLHLEKDGNMGVRDNTKSVMEFWLKNMRATHALAEEFGIAHFAFLQPILESKKNLSLSDYSLLNLEYEGGIREKGRKNVIFCDEAKRDSEIQRYRRRGEYVFERKDMSGFPWITDCVDMFTDENVYYDNCHLYSEGNRIVAEKIYEKIGPTINEIINKRVEIL